MTNKLRRIIIRKCRCLWGWVVFHPDLFEKLDFEIAVDQQTKAHDRTFEGVSDSRCPPVPARQPRPCLVNFWLNLAKSP